MMLFRKLIAVAALTAVIFSCNKELSVENEKAPIIVDASWEFTEAGTVYNGEMDSSYIQTQEGGINLLTLSGSGMPEKNGEILIQIVDDDLAVGEYKYPQVFFQYIEGGAVVFENDPTQENLSIIITAIDSISVSGTFSGTVQDAQGNQRSITDGKFTAQMGAGFDQGPEATGQVTLWTKQICADGGQIEIIIGDQNGFITDAFTEEPLCAAEGTTTFTLPVGNYTAIAVCGTDSTSYEFSVIADNCTLVEVNMAVTPLLDTYLPLTIGSTWQYAAESDPGITNTLTVDGEEVLDGRNYQRIINSFGDIVHYRNQGSDYYQYVTLDFEENVTTPPTIEVVILRDNYQAGDSWETPEYDVLFSGVPVRIKLVSVIVDRDYSEEYNGKQYDNLINVRTELMLSIDGGTNFDPTSSFTTVFSKGVGIVSYEDLKQEEKWNITDHTIAP